MTRQAELTPEAARHLAALTAWRALSRQEQMREFHGDGLGPAPEADGRVRVGIWFPGLTHGGAETQQDSLVRHTDPAQIVWVGGVGTMGAWACNPDLTAKLAEAMPIGYGLGAARTLAQRCDVIINWAEFDIARVLDGIEDPPKVINISHFPEGATTAPRRPLDPIYRYVAVSELALDSIPPDRRADAAVIWNAVDPDRLEVRRSREQVRASWGVPPDALVVGYLGRYAPEKGADRVVMMAPHLPEPWHVVLVGEGVLHDSLKLLAGGRPNVHILQPDRAVGDVLNAFDVLVVPSDYESFGLTLAEGLWVGVPVISTEVGIAKLVPGLTRLAGPHPSGAELADVLLADRGVGTASRVSAGIAFARGRLGVGRFGREWTELLVEAGTPRCVRAPIPDPLPIPAKLCGGCSEKKGPIPATR